MKAIIKENRGHGIKIQDVEKPILKTDEVLVKVSAVSICGSDLHMYEGMESYSWVDTPVILGHEFTGEVIDINNESHKSLLNKRVVINPYIPCGECKNCQKGLTNLCDHNDGAMDKAAAKSLRYGFRENGGMAEYAAIYYKNVLEIPENVSDNVAGMLEAIGIGVRALERADILPGNTAVVIGPGPIGLSMISSLSNYGLDKLIVTGLRKDQKRLELALELGATDIIYADEENPIEAVSKLTNGEGVDNVFETSGFHQSLVDGVRMCTKGSEVLLIGITPKNTELPSNEIVRGEITIKGVYGVTERTMKRAISMAASGKYPYENLVSHTFTFDEAENGFKVGLNKEAVKVILKPNYE